jgi:hypothetical protein
MAYLAGLIDGEGSFIIKRSMAKQGKKCRRGFQRRYILTIANTSKELLTEVQERLGYGNLVEHKQNQKHPNWKTGYTLRFYEGKLRELIPQVMPFLILKQNEAQIISTSLSIIKSTSTKEANEHEHQLLELENRFKEITEPRVKYQKGESRKL